MRVPEASELARGAYGFRISGLEEWADELCEVPGDWPELAVEFRIGAVDGVHPPGTVRALPDRAEVWLGDGDHIVVLREPAQVRFVTRERVPAAAVLHPFLGLPAALAGRWRGLHALHGGAVLHRGRAWAVLGERESGKSSMLGQLLATGLPVLSDDILLSDGRLAFAGPRSIDLREDAAHLGGEALGFVGNRPRWRLHAASAPASAPLGGVVGLEWGPRELIEPLDAESRLRLLIASSAFRPGPESRLRLLELAALPAWRYVRPRRLSPLASQAQRLLDVLGGELVSAPESGSRRRSPPSRA